MGQKGRHTGTGHRKGKSNARFSHKRIWLIRLRVLRRLLKKYREQKKINKHLFRELYLACKGNQFKNKNVLVEAIHKMKAENKREEELAAQAEARRIKNAALKQKRADKKMAQTSEKP